MINWIDKINEYRIVSKKAKFIESRHAAEIEARYILNNKCGNMGEYEFRQLLELCNKEHVPPNVFTTELKSKEGSSRFGLSINGNNVNLIIECLDEFNKYVADIWKAKTFNDSIEILGNFWDAGKVKGAGVGFPTMILYLKDPSTYNVYLPRQSKALGFLPEDMSNKYIHDDKYFIKRNRKVSNYMAYNKSIIYLFGSYCKFQPDIFPQEIDYLLFRVHKEVTNSG